MKVTPDTLRQIRELYELTQPELAKLVGSKTRTVQNWEAPEGSPNHRPIPEPVKILLRVLLRHGVEALLPDQVS